MAGTRPWLGFLVGGVIAGALDLTSAYISFGANVPRGIAAGLLGPSAHQGGLGLTLWEFSFIFLSPCRLLLFSIWLVGSWDSWSKTRWFAVCFSGLQFFW